MTEYEFEYTNQGFAYLLFLLSFVILAVSAIVLSKLFGSVILLDVVLSIAISVTFFLTSKHRIKKAGKAKLLDSKVVWELENVKEIAFDNIKYYYSYNGKNGIVFKIGLHDGSKVKIGANNNFCNIEPLETLLADFKSIIEAYKTEYKVDIVEVESVFARKNTIYILSLITIIIIMGYIFTSMPLMIVSIGFTLPILINWIKYFQLKRNGKLVDF